MKPKTKKFLIIFTFIILLFSFLNPTRKDFIEYLGYPNDHKMNGLSRKYNFIIFSIYTSGYPTSNNYAKYFAILKNFIKTQ